MNFFSNKIIYPILDLDFCIQKKISIFEVLNIWKKYPSLIKFFQYRAKSISDPEYKEIYNQLKKQTELPIIINDRFEIAISENSFGLHLGKEDFLKLDNFAKNKIQNSKITIKGTSSHSIQDVKDLENEFWDYSGFGPMNQTSTKISDYTILTSNELKKAIKISKIPLVPIGGINFYNFEEFYIKDKAIPAAISSLIDEKMFSFLLDFKENKSNK